jgi:hypothetical protein
MDVGILCTFCNWDDNTWRVLGGLGIAGLAAGVASVGDFYHDWPSDDPSPPPPPPPAPDPGVGLNDLFGNTDRFGGVGDTANPTYSDTSVDDRIAAGEQEQQRLDDQYRATHPGATTAGPTQPTTTEQGGAFFRRAIDKHIMEQ